jgi:hypothetical protein
MEITAGTTNVSVDVRLMSTLGAALTGKVAADCTAWYRRDGAKTAIALSDLALLTTAHTDGGFKEIGDGWYRLDVPDAAFATGANRVAIGGTVDGGVMLSAPVTLTTHGTTTSDIKKLLEADIAIDTTTTPWAIVFLEKDTGAIGVGTELLRQSLKDTVGANIANTTTVIGQVGL